MWLELPPSKYECKKPDTSEKWLLSMYSLICMCRRAPAAALQLTCTSPIYCRSQCKVDGSSLAHYAPSQGRMSRDLALPAAMLWRLCTDLIWGGEKRRKTRFLCQLFVCHNLFPQRSKGEAGVKKKCDNKSQFGPYFAPESCATTHFLCLGAGCKETGQP